MVSKREVAELIAKHPNGIFFVEGDKAYIIKAYDPDNPEDVKIRNLNRNSL